MTICKSEVLGGIEEWHPDEAAIEAAVRALEGLALDPGNSDPEIAHLKADMMLLELIDDEHITNAFMALPRWYA